MLARIAQWQPDQGAAATARAVGALALAALAVIHVVDLPGTLGPDRLVGIGYFAPVCLPKKVPPIPCGAARLRGTSRMRIFLPSLHACQ